MCHTHCPAVASIVYSILLSENKKYKFQFIARLNVCKTGSSSPKGLISIVLILLMRQRGILSLDQLIMLVSVYFYTIMYCSHIYP